MARTIDVIVSEIETIYDAVADLDSQASSFRLLALASELAQAKRNARVVRLQHARRFLQGKQAEADQLVSERASLYSEAYNTGARFAYRMAVQEIELLLDAVE